MITTKIYESNTIYRFWLADKVYYTGYVIKEDSLNIVIRTIKDEEIVINKQHILKAIKQDGWA